MKATVALAALFTVAILAPAASAADKPAAKGVKCGSSYIAAGKTCAKMAAPAKSVTTPAKTMVAKPTAAPVKSAAVKPAGKGVKCGNSYIAAGKTCTKK